jgi:membrane protease subunit HflK
VREVVGKMKMDAALAEERDQIAPRVRKLMQTILDRYKVGVEVVGINLQQGGVRPPEQVQAAFDDVLKAGQERERAKNEAQAYANDVVPLATGTSSRLKEESEAYKARIVAQAQGDASRFSAVLAEYQKAPQVTRDRMYTDAMQQIYASTTKVLVESQARLQPAVPAARQAHAAWVATARPQRPSMQPARVWPAPRRAQSSVIPVAP